MLASGDPVVVRLLKSDADDVTYAAVVVRDDGNHIVVEGPWAEAGSRDLGFVTFEPGDVFTEHYWRDRWYSVKQIRSRDGALKGWYTDIARPARVDRDAVVSEDLHLDLWVSSDRATILRLDEDEFEASGLAEADPEAAREATAALDRLVELAAGDWDSALSD